ncbi:MAG TPA: tRNA pseudouridine(38-40) synthase TruA, partial [Candidatus Binatia bacterium]|nr:tRNA pseudouridine(38-40) synthase TruA [Candidatus Binatia bacterium]
MCSTWTKSAPSRTAPSRSADRASFRAVVEYDGTEFSGFQFQPSTRTIAGELERAISAIFQEPVKITGAGRTDAGVHATGQVISFSSERAFPVERLAIA